jgi:hypothetical protein
MLCVSKTAPSTIDEPQSESCPAHGSELTAGGSTLTGHRHHALRFIPDSSHTIPEYVWGDEGPMTI